MNKTRAAIGLVALVALVAVLAGVVSFGHIETLALAEHQTLTAARLYPLIIDGLIVAGSAILLTGSRLGWLGVVPGVAMTGLANIESGVTWGWLAAAMAVVPAISFAVACFMLERWLKAQASHPQPPCSHLVAGPVDEMIVNAYLHTRDCLGEVPSQRQLAERFDVGRPKVATLVGSLNGHGQP